MPKLKSLDSEEIIKILHSFGFEINSQRGSHVKLIKNTRFHKQILIIPKHKELKKGTLKAIFNQASKFISSEELEKHFYTK